MDSVLGATGERGVGEEAAVFDSRGKFLLEKEATQDLKTALLHREAKLALRPCADDGTGEEGCQSGVYLVQ